MWGELARSFQSGDIYIMTILFLFFVGTVIVFERLIMLKGVYAINFKKFLLNFRKMVSSEDFDRAMNLCKSVSKTSLPKIALAALEAAENDPTTIKGTIEEETIEFLPKVENRINILPSLATFILLTGVVGTIDSLWVTFHSINVLDNAQKQASLSSGVANALNPTALGLIVCMFILIFHQIIRSTALTIIERTHHGVTVLHNLLVPQEVAFVAPPTQSNDAPMPSSYESAASSIEPEPRAEEGVQSDDAFDDASVEDIKDEEEII